MAHARQRIVSPDQQLPVPPTVAPREAARGGTAASGGPVGAMHADLARRLAPLPAPVSAPGERLVRFLSVAGGYAALAAGYVGVAMLLLR